MPEPARGDGTIPRAGGAPVFAVAAILMLVGGWVLLVCLLDLEPFLGVFDLQALGEAIGHGAAHWVGAGVLTAILPARSVS